MAAFRIYVDESGTHSDEWFILGMLFVPNHGALHSDLLAAKKSLGYLNRNPKRKAIYKETHLTEFKRQIDLDVATKWIDAFVANDCWFRSIVVDWSIWDASYFGDPFDPAALKKRRAYKKWAEMLLQPEFSSPLPGRTPIRNANLYLDKLLVAYNYDVLDHLKDRFTENYQGKRPYVKSFEHTASWRDANQCLQLCDVLLGGLYQTLVPSTNQYKLATRDYLEQKLQLFGVDRLAPSFWKGWHHSTLREHLPKYSAWFWKPETRRRKR